MVGLQSSAPLAIHSALLPCVAGPPQLGPCSPRSGLGCSSSNSSTSGRRRLPASRRRSLWSRCCRPQLPGRSASSMGPPGRSTRRQPAGAPSRPWVACRHASRWLSSCRLHAGRCMSLASRCWPPHRAAAPSGGSSPPGRLLGGTTGLPGTKACGWMTCLWLPVHARREQQASRARPSSSPAQAQRRRHMHPLPGPLCRRLCCSSRPSRHSRRCSKRPSSAQQPPAWLSRFCSRSRSCLPTRVRRRSLHLCSHPQVQRQGSALGSLSSTSTLQARLPL